MPLEIEKKYLLRALPGRLGRGERIYQGYISCDDPEVRVRRRGKSFFLTEKRGKGMVRAERELVISKDIFEILWPLTRGARLDKCRYKLLAEDGHVWEIDRYAGRLSGLITAEVELSSEGDSIRIPSVIMTDILADITEDSRYKNKNLALHGLPGENKH